MNAPRHRRFTALMLAGALALGASAANATLTAPAEPVFAHPADIATVRTTLGSLAQTLTATQVISGPYTQRKYLHELPKPLIAEGDFLFVRDLGVDWRTIKPFASELIITHDTIVERQDGTTAARLDADQQPAVRLVARIFFAVFSLDFEQLSELFTLSVLNDADGHWQLGLQPKQAAGQIDAIVVRGAAQGVEQVKLLEHGGDRTEIDLHDAQLSPQPADALQRARFH